jgi:hypothetical protein
MPADNTPTPEAIASHLRDSAKRKRSAWRLVWIVCGALLLLLIVAPIGLYLGWQARGKALLREQIALIPADEPLTTGEIAAWYALPEGTRDITAIWIAAIAPFESSAYVQDAGKSNLPFVGPGEEVSLAQPWDAAEARDFLDRYQPQIAALYAAAAEDGAVRYPRDFRDGIGMLLPEAQQVRSASRALQLEFYTLAQADDFAALRKNLETRLKLGDTLEHEALLISMLVRVAVHLSLLSDVRKLATDRELTDEQLAELQDLVRDIDLHGQLPKAMVGERVWVYHSFHTTGFDPRGLESGEQPTGVESNRSGEGVTRGEDAAKSLELFHQLVAAAREPLPEALDRMSVAEKNLQDVASGGALHKLRYLQTLLILPATTQVAVADARGEAMRNLVDALIAVRRYHLKHGQPPASVIDLTPEFLPAKFSIDPFDGQSLRMVRPGEPTLRLYSIGQDRVDNQGQSDETWQPDIAVGLELR